MSIQTAEKREAGLQGLRELLAFLEAHPDVPVPSHSTLFAFILREQASEAERFDALFDIADTLDAPVVEDPDGDRKTARHFGSFTLAVVAQAGDRPKAPRRIVTRPSRAPQYGECRDEQMRSVA